VQVGHENFVRQVVTAEVKVDFEFLIEGELLRAKESEHRAVQFIDQGISTDRMVRFEFRTDFQCYSFQATVPHEKVSDGA